MNNGDNIDRRTVARGAWLAMLSRTGALIEAIAQPLYIWLFGLAAYGIFVTLWAAMNLVSKLIDLSMTSALQRLVPGETDEARVHAVLRVALLVALLPSLAIAIAMQWWAGPFADFIGTQAGYRLDARVVALFAWALPLWTFVEMATSAIRAKGAFGPEIRLRIFWEQVLRIAFALIFFTLGQANGLILAYLASLSLTAAISVRLLARHYRLRLVLTAPSALAPLLPTIGTGIALLPPNLARRLLIDAPPILLATLLPAGGAVAAGLFEVARKISTVPHIVRQAFQYVLAPLASAQSRIDRTMLGPLYRFSTRLSTALVLPLGGFIACAGADILSVYRPETIAALPALQILVAGRVFEAIVGPAGAVVEMIGHRLLPLLNSALGVGLWLLLALPLTPHWGLLAMAAAVSAGTVVMAWAGSFELYLSDGLKIWDRWIARCIAVGAGGLLAMLATIALLAGPARFAALVAIWLGTSWLAVRHGLPREDREALGGTGAKLRLA